MRIGDGGMRHVNQVNDLLKERGGAVVGLNVENGGNGMGQRKVKRTAYLTNEINKSQDKQSNHMIINKQLETDQRAIMERTIGNQSKNNH